MPYFDFNFFLDLLNELRTYGMGTPLKSMLLLKDINNVVQY